jgi:energy-coupling factor transporter ATP-binding protein EcfA2
MRPVPPLKRFCIITGHYGCGKTNLAVNLALDLSAERGAVTLVDLDIVNPYFRSSDFTNVLAASGVRVIAPTFAGTTLDVPSLSAAVYSVFDDDGVVLVDAGGDDVGATALGRFAAELGDVDYDMLYVINRYRALTATPQDAARLLPEIERASHLKATGVVNNSHLRDETTLATVLDSRGYAEETARLLGLPLRFTTVPEHVMAEVSSAPGAASWVENAYAVRIHVRTPWEEPS